MVKRATGAGLGEEKLTVGYKQQVEACTDRIGRPPPLGVPFACRACPSREGATAVRAARARGGGFKRVIRRRPDQPCSARCCRRHQHGLDPQPRRSAHAARLRQSARRRGPRCPGIRRARGDPSTPAAARSRAARPASLQPAGKTRPRPTSSCPGGPETVGKVAPLAAQCPTLRIRRSRGLSETLDWVNAPSVPWLWRQNSTRLVGEIGKGVKSS